MSEQPLIYLDNAATTFPKPEAVYREMDSFYRNFGGNAGRGANPLARRAIGIVNETRAMLQDWLSASEIVFAPSSTIALNTVIFGASLRSGDVVYVTPFEHNSILRPLEHLRKTIGIQVRVLPFDKKTFVCDLNQVRALFKLEPPTMVCVSQVSNVFGVVLPIDEIAGNARQASSSVIVLVDGTQAAGLKPLPMAKVDALVFSGHKSLYGPYGVAGIAFGRAWRPAPLIYGGTGTQSESIQMPREGSSRYEAGSLNVSAIAGLRAALCWLVETKREVVNAHIDMLTSNLYRMLHELVFVNIYAPQETYLNGIISFNVGDISPQAIENALGTKNIAVRAGLHCSPWAHEFAGSNQQHGTVRASISYFNDYDDIVALRDALHDFHS